MNFTKEQLSEVLGKHNERERGLQLIALNHLLTIKDTTDRSFGFNISWAI